MFPLILRQAVRVEMPIVWSLLRPAESNVRLYENCAEVDGVAYMPGTYKCWW